MMDKLLRNLVSNLYLVRNCFRYLFIVEVEIYKVLSNMEYKFSRTKFGLLVQAITKC